MIDPNTLSFYQKNKDCTWNVQPIPQELVSSVDIANWILNESNFGWIELDINISVSDWQLESTNASYVGHRTSNNQGWNSCCIHGIDIEKTGAWTNYGYINEAGVPYKWTELSNKTPIIKNFWKDQFPSDAYRRIRFMQLEPDSAITPHSDMPGKLPGEDNFNALEFGIPVNIAVIHPADCHMVLEGYGIVPFKEGKAFIINIRNYHSVVNFSNQPRIHMIGHSFGYGSQKEKFSELVVKSYRNMLK
jgi:hypothetical protein